MANINEIIGNPNFLAYKFNFETENIEFLPIDSGEISRVSALKLEYIDPGRRLISVPLAGLTGLLESPARTLQENPPRFIFHTAFCASTFLSRCLDVEGYATSLREPQLLLDAANAKRLQWRSRTTRLDYRELARLALLLLQKHARGSEKLLIKPINSVNNIAAELLQISGQTKSLMLYTDARNFLLSTLRKGEAGKHVTRAMFDLLRCDFPHLSNVSLSAFINMTDWNVILTLWRLQIEQAEMLLREQGGNGLMASVHGEKLASDTSAALQAANRFLDLGIPESRINDIAQSDVRFKDAKVSGQAFSVKKRAQRYQKIEQFYGDELEQIFKWMCRNNPSVQIHPNLSGALY